MPNPGSEQEASPEQAREVEIALCRDKRKNFIDAETVINDNPGLTKEEKAAQYEPIRLEMIKNKARLFELIKNDPDQIMIEVEAAAEEIFAEMAELIEQDFIDEGNPVHVQTIFENEFGDDFWPKDWPEGLRDRLEALQAKYPGLEIE